jgi:hypothetical protein
MRTSVSANPAGEADLMRLQHRIDRGVSVLIAVCCQFEQLRWFKFNLMAKSLEMLAWCGLCAAAWLLPPHVYRRHRNWLVFASVAGCPALPHHRNPRASR